MITVAVNEVNIAAAAFVLLRSHNERLIWELEDAVRDVGDTGEPVRLRVCCIHEDVQKADPAASFQTLTERYHRIRELRDMATRGLILKATSWKADSGSKILSRYGAPRKVDNQFCATEWKSSTEGKIDK